MRNEVSLHLLIIRWQDQIPLKQNLMSKIPPTEHIYFEQQRSQFLRLISFFPQMDFHNHPHCWNWWEKYHGWFYCLQLWVPTGHKIIKFFEASAQGATIFTEADNFFRWVLAASRRLDNLKNYEKTFYIPMTKFTKNSR